MNKYVRILAAFGLAAMLSAAYGAPKWTQINTGTIGNLDEIAFVRDLNGVLHMVWRKDEGDTFGVRYRSLSSDGKTLSTIVSVVSGWGGLANPGLRLKADGTLQALYAGTGDPVPPVDDGPLHGAEGGTDGTVWTELGGLLSHSTEVSATDVVSAAPGPNLVSAWATGGVAYHMGQDSLLSNEFDADQSGCCGYYPSFGMDAVSGDIYLGWQSLATDHYGHLVQRVSPMDLNSVYAPQSARADRNATLNIRQRVAITGREDEAGVFVAYCTGYPGCDAVKVWRIGDASPRTVDRKGGAKDVGLSKGPDGKLWVSWVRGSMAYATRSNADVTQFGRVQSIPLPGDQTSFRMYGDGTTGALDLLVNVGLGGPAHYHARFKPTLTLKANRKKVPRGKKVKFTVTDAGEPVEDARVKAFGRNKKTNAFGKATIKVPKGTRKGKKRTSAAKGGYVRSNVKKIKVT